MPGVPPPATSACTRSSRCYSEDGGFVLHKIVARRKFWPIGDPHIRDAILTMQMYMRNGRHHRQGKQAEFTRLLLTPFIRLGYRTGAADGVVCAGYSGNGRSRV